ncbi:hypothetical protein CTI14_54655, partial [Methylobacterium radiotolerans]
TDTAADHAATEGNPDGCSTMPQDVAKRLQSEGVRAPGGGLDISASANPEAVDLINGAANVVVRGSSQGWAAGRLP